MTYENNWTSICIRSCRCCSRSTRFYFCSNSIANSCDSTTSNKCHIPWSSARRWRSRYNSGAPTSIKLEWNSRGYIYSKGLSFCITHRPNYSSEWFYTSLWYDSILHHKRPCSCKNSMRRRFKSSAQHISRSSSKSSASSSRTCSASFDCRRAMSVPCWSTSTCASQCNNRC